VERFSTGEDFNDSISTVTTVVMTFLKSAEFVQYCASGVKNVLNSL